VASELAAAVARAVGESDVSLKPHLSINVCLKTCSSIGRSNQTLRSSFILIRKSALSLSWYCAASS
jgi:hypothetical protein